MLTCFPSPENTMMQLPFFMVSAVTGRHVPPPITPYVTKFTLEYVTRTPTRLFLLIFAA